MDAAAYLKKQGWRGSGHSLDHTDRGIVKPLQISKKVDALGVGIQKYAAVSDQWWLRAYDQGLKDLGSGKESALATAQKHGVNRGGLYARFVKGQDIPGTIGQREDGLESKARRPPSVQGTLRTAERISSVKGKKSQGLKRKALDGNDAEPKRKKTTSSKHHTSTDNATTTTSTTISESGQQCKELLLDIRKQIRAYVDEATRRGILPPDTAPARQKTLPPRQEDMTAVLRLAKLHKARNQAPQLLKREKLVRNLKRAACKYLESQMQTTPP